MSSTKVKQAAARAGKGKKKGKTEVVPVVPNRRRNRRRNRVKLVDPPYKLVTPPSINPDSDQAIKVITSMDPRSLKTMLFSLASYLMQLGFLWQGPRSLDLTTDTLWGGMDFMLNGIWEEIRSGTAVLSRRPKIAHDVIAALSNKTITVRGGKMSYSWSTDINQDPIDTTLYGNVTYYVGTAVGDTPRYDDTNITPFVGPGTLEQYSKMLKYFDGMNNSWLKPVSSSSYSALGWDVSTRARCYAYNGTRPTGASGWAKSVENEVPIIRPILSTFVPYDNNVEDKRIPTQLTVTSGDPCSSFGLLFSGYFGNTDTAYVNKCPPRYVFLDFENFYDTLCLWMVKLKNAAQVSVNQGLADYAVLPFTFTQQDFRIALIQSLKGALGTSYITQFVGPLAYNQQGNQFIPSTNGCNNYANVGWARQMLVPSLIAENICALKVRAVEVPGKKNSHCATYVPVLGRWWQDTPAEYTIESNGEGTVPLFYEDPSQDAINILDGSMGNTPVNLNNAWYQQVIDNWNAHVTALSTYSSKTQPMAGDQGPLGLPLVVSTLEVRGPVAVNKDVVNVAPTPVKKISLIDDAYVANYEAIKEFDAKTKKMVRYVPAATTIQLDELTTYTLVPSPSTEFVALLSNLIIPTIRLNSDEPGDVLNSNMYAVQTREISTVPMGQFGNINTQSLFARWDRLASYCTVGIGKDHSNTYEALISKLQENGQASGFLSTIASIVGSIFPPVAPIANAVASIVDK